MVSPRTSIAALSLVLVGAAVAGLSARQPTPVLAVVYRLSAAYDPVGRTISGAGRVTWQNPAGIPANEVRLLAPWNGRRHGQTTWARESQALGRLEARADVWRGSLDLSSVRLATGTGTVDLTKRVRQVAPDDGNAEDASVLVVPLDEPVGPGQRVELEVEWTARVPDLADGFGAYGSFVLASEWYPRVAVYDDKGWHAHQTHVGVQRAGAIGQFDVALSLPRGWTVGATGTASPPADHPSGLVTHRFRAGTVADFAWAASPSFVERTDELRLEGGGRIDLRVLISRAHASQADRHLGAAKAALTRYRDWFGWAAGQTLTIVDVPEPGGLTTSRGEDGLVGAYPGLIAVHTPWIAPWSADAPERAVVAGVGAQLWSLSAQPELDAHGWMGAGITNYLTTRLLADAYPGRFSAIDVYLGGLARWPTSDVRPGWPTMDHSVRSTSLSSESWRQAASDRATDQTIRAPLAFLALERSYGWEMVRAALSTYAARAAGRHPTPDEFLAIASSAAGRDVSGFLARALREDRPIDYAVSSVATTALEGGAWRSTITLARHGEGVYPVDVRITFADSSSRIDRWDGVSATRVITQDRPAPVVLVELDPDVRLPFEARRTNNSWAANPRGPRAATKWSLRWAAWLQHLLLSYAYFA